MLAFKFVETSVICILLSREKPFFIFLMSFLVCFFFQYDVDMKFYGEIVVWKMKMR